MALRKSLLGLVATCAWLVLAGSATAAFPNFSDCPAAADVCLNVKNTSGNLNIKGFNVPLHESLEIRGGLVEGVFTPPADTNGFFSTPVPVPGGLLGIEGIPGTNVLAITELAGSPSAIQVEAGQGSISIPVKVRLVNTLLGMNCHIGTDRSPVVLNLITGTTNPPPPNRPVSGAVGTPSFPAPNQIVITGNVNVENSFAVPGSSSCGLGLGLINALVNAKLKLPSAAGNNSIEIHNNLAIELR